ncbi:MAG: hypothetical protein RL605_200 [Actinomycetota bacterium]
MRSLFAARALVSFAAGLIVVFNQGQYVAVCLIALAVYGIGVSITQLPIAFFGKGSLSAIESIPTSIIALTIGVLAALAQVQNPSAASAIREFTWLATGWALTSGAFELYLARRAGLKSMSGRDFGILSGLSLLLGLVYLGAYLGISIDRTTSVGLFVAYLMFSAVHLGLAAASPKADVGKNPSAK